MPALGPAQVCAHADELPSVPALNTRLPDGQCVQVSLTPLQAAISHHSAPCMLCTPDQCLALHACPGGLSGKSLLAKDQPSVWYVAAASLPILSSPSEGGGDAPAPLKDEQIEELRQRSEDIVANEAAAFERELKRKNFADYKWITQVKRSGTTSDKVAAITLQLQVSRARPGLEATYLCEATHLYVYRGRACVPVASAGACQPVAFAGPATYITGGPAWCLVAECACIWHQAIGGYLRS